MFFEKETKTVKKYDWKLYKQISCNMNIKDVLSNITHGHWIIQSHNYLHTIYCCSYCDNNTCSFKLRVEKCPKSLNYIILYSGICNKTDHIKYPTGSLKNKKRRVHRYIYNQIQTQMFISCKAKHIYRYLELTYLKSPITYDELTTICKNIRTELKKGYNIFDVKDRCEFYNSNKISSKLEYENKKDNTNMFTVPFIENDTFKNDDDDIKNCKIIVYTTPKLVERNLKNTLLKEEIFLTMDGTFQTIQCGRKYKKGDKLWVSISLGTVTLKWNSEKRIWINSYRPFLFAISESENSRATEALFLSFYKLSEWIGFDRSSYIITGFTSDGALAFQNIAKRYFPLVKVATCWPHISRKPFEKWAGKTNSIASHIHKSLCLLYSSRSKEEFDAIYIYVKEYLKNLKDGAKAIKKMRHSCEELEFRHSLLPLGYVSHTQCIERFNRSGNEMPVLKSDGKVFTNPICGGLYGLLRHAETNNCSEEFNDDISYIANDRHYDKNMLNDAKKIIENGDINIELYYPEKEIRDRDYEIRKLWQIDFKKRQNRINIDNNNNNDVDEYITPACICNLSVDDLYYEKRIIIDNKNYFEYKEKNRYYIGKIVGIIPVDTQVVPEMTLLSGISGFLNYEKDKVREKVYCFRIETTLDGENYDKYGTYCIKLKCIKNSLLKSLSSKRILKKIRLKYDNIINLNSIELLHCIKNAYDASKKKSTGKKRMLENLYETDLEYYAVNSIDNLNIAINEKRILDVVNSKKGIIKLNVKNENILDTIKERSFGIHTVIYNNNERHFTCDCATFHKTAFCCSHIYAVKNYVMKDFQIPI